MPRAKAKRSKLGVYWREGVAWIQFRGKRWSLRTSDPEAAELAAKLVHRKAADPAYAAASVSSLASVTAAWLADTATAQNRPKPPSPETLEMYGYHIGHFCRVLGAKTPIALIDSTAADRYIGTRRREFIGKAQLRTVSARTVDKELGTFRQILRHAARRGLYHLNVDLVFPPSNTGEYVPIKRHLTLEQVWALLEVLPYSRAATCAFVVALGADWCAVPRAVTEDIGSATYCALTVLVRGSKNARRFAEVPVAAQLGQLANIARAWLVAHGRFPSWGNKTRDLAAACERANLPRVTIRDLRRSFGMILRAGGVSPHLIGRMLRHSDSRMAELVYAGLEPADLGRLVAQDSLRYASGTR